MANSIDYNKACIDAIDYGFSQSYPVLIAALPAMGKSTGVVKWAAQTGNPVTIFAPRHDLYADYKKWADEHGLSFFRLPSFHHDCDTAREPDTDEEDSSVEKQWRKDVRREYGRGRTGVDIHTKLQKQLGSRLPCQQDGECPYMLRRKEDLEAYDVLVGHYSHALHDEAESKKDRNEQGTEEEPRPEDDETDSQTWIRDRYVAFDEFPQTGLLNEFDSQDVRNAITAFIDNSIEFPIRRWSGIGDIDYDTEVKEEAIDYLHKKSDELWDKNIARTSYGHANAPVFIKATLVANRLDNEWRFASVLPRLRVAISPGGTYHVLSLPDVTPAKGVVALDGTPTTEQWDLILGETLHHEYVHRENWNEYIRDHLKLRLIQTSEDTKPYTNRSGNSVSTAADLTFLEAIRVREGQRPDLITSKVAIQRYKTTATDQDIDFDELVGGRRHYGAFKGLNNFGESRLGVVIGSQHFGDPYIEMWGALLNTSVARRTTEKGENTRGSELTYTHSVGDAVLRGMRENETLQAAMRFGRDGGGAKVYLHTRAIPDWVDVEYQPVTVRTWEWGKYKGRKWVFEGVQAIPEWETEEWTTRDVADQICSLYEEAQNEKDPSLKAKVRNHLNNFEEARLICHEERGPGNKHYWWNTGLDRASIFGYVTWDELSSVGAA